MPRRKIVCAQILRRFPVGPEWFFGQLPQALRTDWKACADGARYDGHHLQEFGRALETPSRVFLEERLK